MRKNLKSLFFACKRICESILPTKLLAFLAEHIVPVKVIDIHGKKIKYYCLGTIPLYRYETLLTKEPETIEWMDSLDTSGVLWDVGANVGIYSIYAANRGLDVIAIEPMPANYYTLTKNIELNNFGEKVAAFCFALTNEVSIDFFYISGSQIGSSQNSFKENIGWNYKEMEIVNHKHTTLGMSVDKFVEIFKPKIPNYIKIDVDGLERNIIVGARETLSRKELKSMLVELSTDWEDYNHILELILSCGFTRWEKKRADIFENSEMKNSYNHIFYK